MTVSYTSSHELVLILDFGSQYTHLIARRLREAGVYCELQAHDLPADRIRALSPRGLILSGGPASVYDADAPHADPAIFSLGIPILGICYGLQELSHALGGRVNPGVKREFGHALVTLSSPSTSTITTSSSPSPPPPPPDEHPCDPLFCDVPHSFSVWMSHADKLHALPPGFHSLAATPNTEHAAIVDPARRFYGLQFHPEVTHSQHGATVLRNFVRAVCACKGDWTMADFVTEARDAIRRQVGPTGTVVGAVSGGVDSTVAAVLLSQAVGPRFHAFLVDNGLLRKDEARGVLARLRDRCGVNLTLIDARDQFVSRLARVTEPERKRKIIGNTFIECFEKEARALNADFLLQGTLYPDVIESVSHKGPSATIKTHHNVGGLPAHMRLELIEPLRMLFKDEVRALGQELGIERESLYRHPFPGPGLAIRILGEVTQKRLDALRKADAIYLEELHAHKIYDEISQAFAVLLPVKAVGVMGDKRTYEEVITLRAVKTTDFMTADWYELPVGMLRKTSNRIVNEVDGVNRVTYDVTSKPPGTIEWE